MQSQTAISPVTNSSSALSTPLVKASHAIAIPTNEEFELLYRIAKVGAAAGLTGKGGGMNDAQAMFIILKGFALGIDPVEALCQIYIVDGKPALAVQMMVSLANRSGLLKSLKIPDTAETRDNKAATVTAVRKDRPDDVYKGTFTLEEAENAGLYNAGKTSSGYDKKPNWSNYWPQMLINRAVSICLRRAVPEALSGMYMVEELAPNITVDPETGAPVNGERVIITPPQREERRPAQRNPTSEETIVEVGEQGEGEQPASNVIDLDSTRKTMGSGEGERRISGEQQKQTVHWAQTDDGKKAIVETLAQYGLKASDVMSKLEQGKTLSRWSETTLTREQAMKRIVEIATAPAQPKSAAKKASGWSDDVEIEFSELIWQRFNRNAADFMDALLGEGVSKWSSKYPNTDAAWSAVLGLAKTKRWGMVAERAIYNGKYIEFVTPERIRVYGRSDKFRAAVGDDYYLGNGIDKWVARTEPYAVKPIFIEWEQKSPKEGAPYLQGVRFTILNDEQAEPADERDPNDIDAFLNDDPVNPAQRAWYVIGENEVRYLTAGEAAEQAVTDGPFETKEQAINASIPF